MSAAEIGSDSVAETAAAAAAAAALPLPEELAHAAESFGELFVFRS